MRALVAVVAALTGCGRLDFDRPPLAAFVLADPGEPLTDFPLVIVLDDTRVDRARLLPDASNLAFATADGRPLAREIEALGAPGGPPLLVWVRVPLITGSTTTLTMGYDGASAGPATDVWDDTYAAVWHMTGTGTVVDSTANHRDGVAAGTHAVAGVVGPARAFDVAQHDCIVVPGLAGVSLPALTASGWLRFHAPSPATYDVVVTRELGDGGNDDFFVGVHGVSPFVGVTRAPADGASAGGPDLGVEEWHHLALTFDTVTLAFTLDGAVRESQPAAGTLATSPGPVYLGCDRDNGAGMTPPGEADNIFLDGELDEVRVETVARSPAWLAYAVAAMQDRVIRYEPK